MKKQRKLLTFLMAMVIVVPTLLPSNAKAQTIQEDGVQIDLGGFYMTTTDYSEDEVIVQTRETNNQVYVTIINKETGNVVETITSTSIPNDSPMVRTFINNNTEVQSLNPMNTTYYAIQRDKVDALNTVRLQILVLLYQSGSFSSVQSVQNEDIFLISSSNATLENTYAEATSATGSFPTAHLRYYGYGTITVTTEISVGDELSIGFSIPEVIDFGYSVNKTVTGTVYLRKYTSIQGDFYTYSH